MCVWVWVCVEGGERPEKRRKAAGLMKTMVVVGMALIAVGQRRWL